MGLTRFANGVTGVVGLPLVLAVAHAQTRLLTLLDEYDELMEQKQQQQQQQRQQQPSTTEAVVATAT